MAETDAGLFSLDRASTSQERTEACRRCAVGRQYRGGRADDWAIAFTRIVAANPTRVGPTLSGWRISSLAAIVRFSVGATLADFRGWVTGDPMLGAPLFWYRVMPKGEVAMSEAPPRAGTEARHV